MEICWACESFSWTILRVHNSLNTVFIIIYDLFDDSVSISDYIATNGVMISD
jgi:hypothetical protein